MTPPVQLEWIEGDPTEHPFAIQVARMDVAWCKCGWRFASRDKQHVAWAVERHRKVHDAEAEARAAAVAGGLPEVKK